VFAADDDSSQYLRERDTLTNPFINKNQKKTCSQTMKTGVLTHYNKSFELQTKDCMRYRIITVAFLWMFLGCSDDPEVDPIDAPPLAGKTVEEQFAGRIQINNLPIYANQGVPEYIQRDNSGFNPITNEGAILGRVLFYDKNLSFDNSMSCSSCHQQKFAFGDTAKVSRGVQGGLTRRHAMRLINARFGEEQSFFWDERAATLETQTSMPIKDHAELGYSGLEGRPGYGDLLKKLQTIRYYNELFKLAFGDSVITETRMQRALAQFVRSIQSFDSKYDEGYTQNFANFTAEEKRGLSLFTAVPQTEAEDGINVRVAGGVGCAFCHRPPEFDIRPETGNNGVGGVANNPGENDFQNTRAPSLRNLANPAGVLNGPLMHDASITSFEDLIATIGKLEPNPTNINLDPILRPGFDLKITDQEALDLTAFLKTLTGKDVYSDERWADPFDP
jgi:cytochrome c peroxidase